MKLTRQVGPLVSEWADTILFANYKTYIVKSDTDKNKAQGGYRIMYTTHHPCWDAKNRDGLADELPFDFEQIRHIIPNSPEAVNSTAVSDKNVQQINKMIEHEDFVEVVEPNEEENISETQVGNLSSSNPVIQALFDLMNENNVSVGEVQAVVADKGYYPADTPIENYDPDFITGVLVGAWSQVYEMIKEYQKIPF